MHDSNATLAIHSKEEYVMEGYNEREIPLWIRIILAPFVFVIVLVWVACAVVLEFLHRLFGRGLE